MIKITKAELDLSFNRFLVDVEDDFFPDPFRYKDLKLFKSDIIKLVLDKLRLTIMKIDSKKNPGYDGHQFFDWDVPKSHFVIRHAIWLHPLDRIIFHFILNRLVSLIEPNLSTARYSYRIKKFDSKHLFGRQPTKNWLDFKADAKQFFADNKKYNYLVSTDVAGFYEYTHITHLKNQIKALTKIDKKQVLTVIELLNIILKKFSPSKQEGIPQNYDPSSYLASAFLDFLDKELEARKFQHFRYVDDIKVVCRDKQHAQQAIIEIIHALRRFNLNLSTIKTEIWHRSDKKFKNFFREFPKLLSEIDDAVRQKNKSLIDKLLPELVKMTREIMKKRSEAFDERLFRACTWRIIKCYWFKNIKKCNLDSIAQKCLKLIEETPGRTDVFTRFLVLLKNRKFVQVGCADIIINTVYLWQEMMLWELLTKADRIKAKNPIDIAQDRVRSRNDSCPARNFAILFLGKHGTYQDREFIASIITKTNSIISKRCSLIALQEYQHKGGIYNSIINSEKDPLLKALITYLKQLKEPEYIFDDKKHGSDLLFIS